MSLATPPQLEQCQYGRGYTEQIELKTLSIEPDLLYNISRWRWALEFRVNYIIIIIICCSLQK